MDACILNSPFMAGRVNGKDVFLIKKIKCPWYSKDKRGKIRQRPTDGSNRCTTGATVPRDAVKVHRW